MLTIETLLSNDKIILSNLFLSSSDKPYTKIVGTQKMVYSRLLDELLNFEKEIISFDDTHTFILSNQMYAMHDVHFIGLKNFNNAKLVIKFLKNN